jgi:hypothetical protein
MAMNVLREEIDGLHLNMYVGELVGGASMPVRFGDDATSPKAVNRCNFGKYWWKAWRLAPPNHRRLTILIKIT